MSILLLYCFNINNKYVTYNSLLLTTCQCQICMYVGITGCVNNNTHMDMYLSKYQVAS